MKKRMRLKIHRKKSVFQKVVISFIFALLLAFLFIYFMNHNLHKSIRDYATLESKQFAKTILNQATGKVLKESQLQQTELYTVQKNKNNEITTVDFNTLAASQVLTKITDEVTEKIIALENGNIKDFTVNQSFQGVHFKKYKNGVVCEIPLGLVTNHFFLANLGYVIPIRFSFVGMMDANMKSKITSYGINNALLELYILVELTEKITMPLSSEEVKVSLEIPFITQMITGKVPTYFQGTLTGSSNILSIPLNESENNENL